MVIRVITVFSFPLTPMFCVIGRIETFDRARNKSRIKICNYMIVGTILGCIFMAWSGKQAAKRGESLNQMNVDWHQAVKDGKA